MAEEIWVCEKGAVTKWEGSIQDYKENLRAKVLKENRKALKDWQFWKVLNNWGLLVLSTVLLVFNNYAMYIMCLGIFCTKSALFILLMTMIDG